MSIAPLKTLPLLKAGSVKNLRVSGDNIVFEFTDDFSVFDWGKMPDSIPGKGRALLGLATHLFLEIENPASWKNFLKEKIELPPSECLKRIKTELETIGMPSCYLGPYGSDPARPEGMVVKKLRMIPLEVVFRHQLTEASSFFERNPGTRLLPGHRFDTPLTERFTKLEPSDRYLETATEACAVGKIDREQLLELELRTVLLALFLKRECGRRDLDLIDGKFEWGFDTKGRMLLGDAIGPDELRLAEKRKVPAGAPTSLSKEFLREYYRGSEWFKEISERKKLALTPGWQANISLPPPVLSADAIARATSLYGNLERRFRRESVLLLGGGAREHAIARKLLESPNVRALHWAPGQDAAFQQLESEKRLTRWEELSYSTDSAETLIKKARTAGITLVILSMDSDLAAGAADRFRDAGFSVFGPSQSASKIEWSKSYSKEICEAAGVSTARAFTLKGLPAAREKLLELPWNKTEKWVVKSDGLALGKGVVVAETREEALASLEGLAQYGDTFLIEERIKGAECSWFAFMDGGAFSLLDPAKDYKRLREMDQGPNTGGMGAISPAPDTTPELRERIRSEVFTPIFAELRKRGVVYQGLLYAGIMTDSSVSPASIRVLEFNARFGDPETEALLPRMEGDLLEWMSAVAENRLVDLPRDVSFAKNTAVYVVAAAEGYPDNPKKGTLTRMTSAQIKMDAYRFAGLTRQGNGWAVTGGRVLGALGIGSDAMSARSAAYSKLEEILFPGAQIRKDIGL